MNLLKVHGELVELLRREMGSPDILPYPFELVRKVRKELEEGNGAIHLGYGIWSEVREQLKSLLEELVKARAGKIFELIIRGKDMPEGRLSDCELSFALGVRECLKSLLNVTLDVEAEFKGDLRWTVLRMLRAHPPIIVGGKPLGPFSPGDLAFVPSTDAKHLLDLNSAEEIKYSIGSLKRGVVN